LGIRRHGAAGSGGGAVSTAPAILARLSAIGARIECRGDRLVVRTGRRPVPMVLIQEARAAKGELSKVLIGSQDAHTRNDEHLRLNARSRGAEMLAAVEDAQMSTFVEHLRAAKQPQGAEDAHPAEAMSTFDESPDFRGFQRQRRSKMLIPPSLSTFAKREHIRAEAAQVGITIVADRGESPREWAEGFAWLDPAQPPGDVPPMRWQQFVDDLRSFLSGDFAAVAAGLGWGPLDLFGCDRDRPFARIDAAGLLWLLNGDRLIALSENTAAIETRTGARQTHRRKPTEPGRVLAWDLT